MGQSSGVSVISGAIASNDNYDDNYDGNMVCYLSSATGDSNYPVIISGFMNANADLTGSDDNDNYPQVGELWTLHAYEMSSTYFRIKGRMETQWGDDGGGYQKSYPTLVSFAVFS